MVNLWYVESVLLGNILTAVIGLPFLFRDMPDGKGWLFLALGEAPGKWAVIVGIVVIVVVTGRCMISIRSPQENVEPGYEKGGNQN